MGLEELWQLFPIILKEHNPVYTAWYNEEKANLLQALCDYDVRRINHIGSTSVCGLIAKPIVDILLELPHHYDMAVIIHLLQQNGWILMQKDEAQKTLDLNKGYTPSGFAEKVFHLHVKPLGDWGELYFRDYLREYPVVARQYETLKQSLIMQFEHNRDAYTDAKSAFIIEYTEKARLEYETRYLPPEH
ncbi:MAG: GrpB family protein [Oscillospiraceae bacterium]|jgi:GrpB-like predicted nucleotidyltransferase (UPF0157 family)|nr:GrpB family protein [Oscillospiraceae bacterium]